MPFTGISDSLIAALLWTAGKRIWNGFNNPLREAIGKTSLYLYREKGIEFQPDKFEKILKGEVGDGLRCGQAHGEGT